MLLRESVSGVFFVLIAGVVISSIFWEAVAPASLRNGPGISTGVRQSDGVLPCGIHDKPASMAETETVPE